ncbi:hypothetical protein BDZ91DRAFT_845506 [Kalaharituber pfeilii]|nr:hypothetical protein BDZ91DRAFT_845506 [Kalaharituber pfeilii]
MPSNNVPVTGMKTPTEVYILLEVIVGILARLICRHAEVDKDDSGLPQLQSLLQLLLEHFPNVAVHFQRNCQHSMQIPGHSMDEFMVQATSASDPSSPGSANYETTAVQTLLETSDPSGDSEWSFPDYLNMDPDTVIDGEQQLLTIPSPSAPKDGIESQVEVSAEAEMFTQCSPRYLITPQSLHQGNPLSARPVPRRRGHSLPPQGQIKESSASKPAQSRLKYPCPRCNTAPKRTDNLRDHVRRVHAETVPKGVQMRRWVSYQAEEGLY